MGFSKESLASLASWLGDNIISPVGVLSLLAVFLLGFSFVCQAFAKGVTVDTIRAGFPFFNIAFSPSSQFKFKANRIWSRLRRLSLLGMGLCLILILFKGVQSIRGEAQDSVGESQQDNSIAKTDHGSPKAPPKPITIKLVWPRHMSRASVFVNGTSPDLLRTTLRTALVSLPNGSGEYTFVIAGQDDTCSQTLTILDSMTLTPCVGVFQ